MTEPNEKITDLNYEDFVKEKNRLFKRLNIAFFVYLAIVVCMYFFLQYQKENSILYFVSTTSLITFIFWLPFVPTFTKWNVLEEKIKRHHQKMMLELNMKKILIEEKKIYISKRINNVVIEEPICIIEERYEKNNIVFYKEREFKKIKEGSNFFNEYNQENAREFIKEINNNFPI